MNTDAIIKECAGLTIKSLAIDAEFNVEDGGLRVEFADGKILWLYDNGRDCCEHRFMSCDDDLSVFVGAKFIGAAVSDGPTIEDADGEHEQQFLKVNTSNGQFTVTAHNAHNGYYSGICMAAKIETPEAAS